jgi:hypothetical protein
MPVNDANIVRGNFGLTIERVLDKLAYFSMPVFNIILFVSVYHLLTRFEFRFSGVIQTLCYSPILKEERR